MEYRFGKGFLWGGACSGPQSEGAANRDGRQPNTWDYWFSQSPQLFFDRVGPDPASGFYEHYRTIIPLMRRAGITSLRTSIQWSRLISDRAGTLNQAGADFYSRVLETLLENGIEPILCLHHFDLPMYWMERGGFEGRETAAAFAGYAARCFSLYGDRVRRWATFNEPIVIVEQGYLYGGHYPAVCDGARAARVGYHLQLASSLCVQAFRQAGRGGEIGVILNLTPSYCPPGGGPADTLAAERADLIYNRSFLDPSVRGEYPPALLALLEGEGVLPAAQGADLRVIRENTVDYLGVNYYHPRRVRARRQPPAPGAPLPEKFFEEYMPADAKLNPYRGWEIYEPALYDIACNLKSNYGNIPWYVSENGMGVEGEERFLGADGRIDDGYRIAFMRGHLKWLHKAIGEGSACFGYHVWCPMDCWSWLNAYKNRYGLIRVDLPRLAAGDAAGAYSLKRSADWFAALSAAGGFADEEAAPVGGDGCGQTAGGGVPAHPQGK